MPVVSACLGRVQQWGITSMNKAKVCGRSSWFQQECAPGLLPQATTDWKLFFLKFPSLRPRPRPRPRVSCSTAPAQGQRPNTLHRCPARYGHGHFPGRHHVYCDSLWSRVWARHFCFAVYLILSQEIFSRTSIQPFYCILHRSQDIQNNNQT